MNLFLCPFTLNLIFLEPSSSKLYNYTTIIHKSAFLYCRTKVLEIETLNIIMLRQMKNLFADYSLKNYIMPCDENYGINIIININIVNYTENY